MNSILRDESASSWSVLDSGDWTSCIFEDSLFSISSSICSLRILFIDNFLSQWSKSDLYFMIVGSKTLIDLKIHFILKTFKEIY